MFNYLMMQYKCTAKYCKHFINGFWNKDKNTSRNSVYYLMQQLIS